MKDRRPFFRADQVGSPLRPPELVAARAAMPPAASISAALRRAEDAAIVDIVRRQEDLGFEVVVDGEFPRENWWIDFVAALSGVEIREAMPRRLRRAGAALPTAITTTAGVTCPRTWSPLAGRRPRRSRWTTIAIGGNRPFAAKVTLPSPTRLHFHGGRKVLDCGLSRRGRPSSPTWPRCTARRSPRWRRRVAAIQIDDPLMTYFISDRLRAEVRDAGDDPDQRLARYAALVNDCIAARGPDNDRRHPVCRGNSRSGWIAGVATSASPRRGAGGCNPTTSCSNTTMNARGDFQPLSFVPRGRAWCWDSSPPSAAR